jgi:hypothetical protein
MADDNEPFHRWVTAKVIVPVVVGVLGLIGIGAGAFLSRGDSSDDKVSSAAQVRACMAQHKMDEAETVTTLPPTTNEYGTVEYVTSYRKCVWPPPSWASPDGYSEIRVTDTDGPGENEASRTNVADIIKSRCSELYVRYSLVAQGSQEAEQPFTSKPNRVVSYTGEAYRSPGPGTGLPFYYKPDELVVLRTMKHRLDEVRCEK